MTLERQYDRIRLPVRHRIAVHLGPATTIRSSATRSGTPATVGSTWASGAARCNIEGNYVYATGVEHFGGDLMNGESKGSTSWVPSHGSTTTGSTARARRSVPARRGPQPGSLLQLHYQLGSRLVGYGRHLYGRLLPTGRTRTTSTITSSSTRWVPIDGQRARHGIP